MLRSARRRQPTIIVFPGTNRENDMKHALEHAFQQTNQHNTDIQLTPHNERTFNHPPAAIVLAGAIAARAPIMNAIHKEIQHGTPVLAVCNGFQIVLESQFLPGALARNDKLRFLCETIPCHFENTLFGVPMKRSTAWLPVAHHEGRYIADNDTLNALEDNQQIVLRYDSPGCNGSERHIAGLQNRSGNLVALMPHPENAIHPHHPSRDGEPILKALAERTQA